MQFMTDEEFVDSFPGWVDKWEFMPADDKIKVIGRTIAILLKIQRDLVLGLRFS